VFLFRYSRLIHSLYLSFITSLHRAGDFHRTRRSVSFDLKIYFPNLLSAYSYRILIKSISSKLKKFEEDEEWNEDEVGEELPDPVDLESFQGTKQILSDIFLDAVHDSELPVVYAINEDGALIASIIIRNPLSGCRSVWLLRAPFMIMGSFMSPC
jgi:hypothetical protein